MQEQNRELVRALGELREREDELMNLNRELEDTTAAWWRCTRLDEKADHLRRADEMKSRFLSNMSQRVPHAVEFDPALSGSAGSD